MRASDVQNLNGGLVLSFRPGEKVVIDTGEETIIVTPIEGTGGKIRLHFQASKSTVIDRLSIWQRKNPGMVQPGLKEVRHASGK